MNENSPKHVPMRREECAIGVAFRAVVCGCVFLLAILDRECGVPTVWRIILLIETLSALVWVTGNTFPCALLAYLFAACPRRPGLATASHKAKLEALSALAQLKPNIASGDGNPAWKQQCNEVHQLAFVVSLSIRALCQEVVRVAPACRLPERFPHKQPGRILRTNMDTATASAC